MNEDNRVMYLSLTVIAVAVIACIAVLVFDGCKSESVLIPNIIIERESKGGQEVNCENGNISYHNCIGFAGGTYEFSGVQYGYGGAG